MLTRGKGQKKAWQKTFQLKQLSVKINSYQGGKRNWFQLQNIKATFSSQKDAKYFKICYFSIE